MLTFIDVVTLYVLLCKLRPYDCALAAVSCLFVFNSYAGAHVSINIITLGKQYFQLIMLF